MSEILTGLLEAGLIEKVDGDESRFEKMEEAAKAVASELKEQPIKLIAAIIAGINPDISETEPAIQMAKSALVNEWKTMSSAYPSPPINLFRAILLEACRQASIENTNAAILWLTAADTIPLMRLGKEETIVRKLLEQFALLAEECSLFNNETPNLKVIPPIKFTSSVPLELSKPKMIDRNALHPKLGDAAGNTHIKLDETNQGAGNPNRYALTNHGQLSYWPHWAGDFAIRMTDLLGDEFDGLASTVSSQNNQLVKNINALNENVIEEVSKKLNEQRLYIQKIAKHNLQEQKLEQTRLNVLWWSEALYSTPLRTSYRELDPSIAPIIMAIDLLAEVSIPTPASVSYMLSETICKLADASFDKKVVLSELLESLGLLKAAIPNQWFDNIKPHSHSGFMTLRDLVITSLKNDSFKLDNLAEIAGIPTNFEISLPVLSRAIFRQEQAVRLAGGYQ